MIYTEDEQIDKPKLFQILPLELATITQADRRG